MTKPLTEAAARVLAKIASELADGFTGEIVIVANQGGVRDLRISRSYRTADLIQGVDGSPV